MKKIIFAVLTFSLICFFGCKKSNQDLVTPSLNDYFPLTVGKYVTYKLDSLVFINFGHTPVTKTFQVKYQNDASITDNLGRPAYRITRYIRLNSAAPWISDNTFMATNVGNSIEFVENNQKFIKLSQIIKNDFTWKGNSYIDTRSINSNYKYLDDWDYTYDSLYLPSTVGALTIDSTLKVNERNEVIGDINNPASYSERNISVEKYAKNIGLIYRNFLHLEYQPIPQSYSDGSYGITLTMIDHN